MARIFGKLAAGMAAISLAVTPAVAAENAASKLSLRAATHLDKGSDLAAGALIALVVVATVAVGTALAASDDVDSQ